MPGFNGKGPEGEGPLTGRGRGQCRSSESPEKGDGEMQEKRPGRWFRGGRSSSTEFQKGKRGRGFRRRFRGGFDEIN